MGKKMLATSIDEELLRDFRMECVKNSAKMNEVLEVLMRAYVRDSDFVYNVLLAENPKNRFEMIERMYEESCVTVEEIRRTREELKEKLDFIKAKEKPE